VRRYSLLLAAHLERANDLMTGRSPANQAGPRSRADSVDGRHDQRAEWGAAWQSSMWSLGLLAVEDVVPMADPKAHRVDRVVVASGRVVRELGPICLAVDDSVPVTLAAEAGVDRLG
jgi:hypothetical protein